VGCTIGFRMPRLSISTRCLTVLMLLFGVLATGAALAQIFGSGPGRLVDIIELTDRGEDQADITILFNCTLRYVTHSPATEGAELRIELRPGADCGIALGGLIPAELPPLSGGGEIIAAVRLESTVPGQISLVFSWKKSERYVLAQAPDQRSLRVRLIDRGLKGGKLLVGESVEPVSGYAVNLESQPKEFEPTAVQLAEQRLKTHTYVSESVVDGQTWYRLRAGPFETRADAEKVLNAALADYPRAWLAIGDDTATSTPSGAGPAEALPAVERMGSDPPLEAAQLSTTRTAAQKALAARDYPTAISLLTKLQRQPEFPQRAQAQELLGLARERAGELAHAKAEYEEYLRRYPTGEAAERVKQRLSVLRVASMRERTTSGSTGQPQNQGWRVDGGFGQTYRFDGTRVSNTVPPGTAQGVPTSAQTTVQNALFNDVDLLARRHGESIDTLARVSGGYSKNFAATAVGSENARVAVASFALDDHALGLRVSLGRQSLNQYGAVGTFDGLFLSYQLRPTLAVNAIAGYPVEQTNRAPQTQRRFEALALALTPTGARWDASAFATVQVVDGVRDRQAVGLQTRYLAPRASVTALLDYDLFFHSLNTATLLGTTQLPDHWNLSFDAERRNSPILTVNNALIGQPATSIAELEQVFTLNQIFQLARDRTPMTSNYSLTASRPLGQRFQFAASIDATQTGASLASGGVAAAAATGLSLGYGVQFFGSSVFSMGDFNVVSFNYNTDETGKTASIAATSRRPIGMSWRIGPRLTVQRRTLASDGSTQLNLVPSVLLDFQRGRTLLQFDAGGELGKRDALQQTQNSQRFYVSLAYRVRF
jgi:hypothetical protein